jgi:hypothetical protein
MPRSPRASVRQAPLPHGEPARCPMTPRLVQHRIHYAWIVAGVTFLTLICAAAFRSTPTVLLTLTVT